MAGKKRKLQRYTPEQREKATQMALAEGPTATSQKLQIPSGTLTCWMFKARQRANEAKPKVQPAVEEVTTESARKVARYYTPSQKAQILECAGKHGPMKTSRKFGVSRWSIREWQRKVRLAAQGKGPSPTSGLLSTSDTPMIRLFQTPGRPTFDTMVPLDSAAIGMPTTLASPGPGSWSAETCGRDTVRF